VKIEVKELVPERWADFEKLFGSTGACGGCWCMSWRLGKGEKWADIKGDEAKNRMKTLVLSGEANGLLAYVDDEPVGWCSYGKRTDYARLDRAPSLKCSDADQVWSVPCFFIKRSFRGKGIGTTLLKHALRAVSNRGGKVLEGYPSSPYKDGQRTPDAFAWTGTVSMFEQQGFKKADEKSSGRLRMRREVK
jgi:GNAT superfamily N-acetyltransferase